MAESEKVCSYVFIWHSMIDARSCDKCRALNGRIYKGQDLFAPQLVDPEFGPIWDLDNDMPLTHPNCRCALEVRIESFDLSKIPELNEVLNSAIKMGVRT